VSKSFSRSKRLFLHSAALTTGSLFLNGCVRHIPTGRLPAANLSLPLTIDVHCHFFNGTDIQLERFIKKVPDANEGNLVAIDAAPLLENINWALAPKGKSEMKKLRSGNVSDEEACKGRNKARASSYGKYRHEVLKHSAEAEQAAGPVASRQNASSASKPQNSELPWRKKYEDYVHDHNLAECGSSGSSNSLAPFLVGGEFPAIKEYFQYRYVALADYLHLYNQATERTIDLIIAHLVDYDWPLNSGKPTKTHLNDQIRLMERLSILSDGRVHTFAPFDPFREIAYQARWRGATWSALDALKGWVANHGCIGVKIYPPMGFAPYGNSEIDLSCWKGVWDWLPNVESVPYGNGRHATIGERLDDVLGQLYSWCLDSDLPVMAHTDLSNGLNKTFNNFTAAEHWATLRDCFGSLRVNFGHCGGVEDTAADDWTANPPHKSVNARELVALMSNSPSSPGGRFFADSAYSNKILRPQADLFDVYSKALSWTAADQQKPVLPDRLMYGSDWSLLMLEDKMQQYFTDFVAMYSRLDESLSPSRGASSTLSNRFFGENAVDYLGLRDGRNRQRLVNFYNTRGMTFGPNGRPAWMGKITLSS
jgi:hypothetical protein